MDTTRVCEICGREHKSIKSPICTKCRTAGSKRKCPIEGCENLMGRSAKTCFQHRRMLKPILYKTCRECGVKFTTPLAMGVCKDCQVNTMVLCACGCGRYRRKYSPDGSEREYISGHNDSKINVHKPPLIKKCAVCGKDFVAVMSRRILCSLECRAKWGKINPAYERKRIEAKCAICGKIVYREPSDIARGCKVVCSKACQYRLLSLRYRGPRTQKIKLAAQRDNYQCLICQFDKVIEVHHIKPKRKDGSDDLENLITLCPNHHVMSDRTMITQKELRDILSARYGYFYSENDVLNDEVELPKVSINHQKIYER